ncbi:MAG: NADP-dependent phosphogluconate dehydrogenase [Paracoccaceae bacterium]
MRQAKIGVYGLGTMGQAMALNLAENGILTAVCNREQDWIAPFLENAGELAKNLIGSNELQDFVARLEPPRTVLFMIPSGKPLDGMLDQILPLLSSGDTVIDAGNANFNDTMRREEATEAKGIAYVGMGVSGGEEGARHGPSMMFGGTPDSWARIKPILTAIAARFNGDPCVDRMGPDGAGHFVKTVHNGIEYADMQMLAEVYGLLRDVGGMPAAQIGAVFESWRSGPLASFLVDVSATALQSVDAASGQPMVDVILDQAGQKGTGRWTVIEALKMGQSASAIEGAVGARSWSAAHDVRQAGAATLPGGALGGDLPDAATLEQALLAGRILSHAQGFNVLRAASDAQGWNLNLARIAEIWRAGCILRSALLDDIALAFHDRPPMGELVLAPRMIATLEIAAPALRRVVVAATQSGLPIPALSAALAWYDTIKQARGSTNLIQAQRDIFGAHGFERLDQPGKHHGDWGKQESPR